MSFMTSPALAFEDFDDDDSENIAFVIVLPETIIKTSCNSIVFNKLRLNNGLF